MRDETIAAALMAFAKARGSAKTFCPSEVARHLATDWRPLMPDVRRVAASLPLRATQRGHPVDPLTASGPIRLSIDATRQDHAIDEQARASDEHAQDKHRGHRFGHDDSALKV